MRVHSQSDESFARAGRISSNWPSSTVLGAGASEGGCACTTVSHESAPKKSDASMMPLLSQTPAAIAGGKPTVLGGTGAAGTWPEGFSSMTRVAAKLFFRSSRQMLASRPRFAYSGRLSAVPSSCTIMKSLLSSKLSGAKAMSPPMAAMVSQL